MSRSIKGTIIGVVGTGQMGKGICQLFAENGYTVILKSRARNTLSDAIQVIHERTSKNHNPEEVMKRIQPATDFLCLKDAGLIIETVPEDLRIKKALLRRLSNICSPYVVLATNTSSLSVTELAESVSNPGRFLGMHFFNPATEMKLVELIYGKRTEKSVMRFAKKIASSVGKTEIILKDSPGFVINRLLMVFLKEAMKMAEDGISSIEDIDRAVKLGLNHPMGPLELADLIGLDVCLNVMGNLGKALKNPEYEPCLILQEKTRKGMLGRKTGKGFYNYRKTRKRKLDIGEENVKAHRSSAPGRLDRQDS